jgi:cytochrome c oxidase cbb3-type subunit 3
MAIALIILMLLLLLVIALLANVLLSTLQFYNESQKKKSTASAVASILLICLSIASPSYAQGSAPASGFGSLSQTAFYLIIAVIAVELLVILFMLLQLKAVLAKEKARKELEEPVERPAVAQISWWDRFNRFRPAAQEAEIDLGHEYDGIRELDNRLPPWWLWGFYITIVAAGIYLWRFHVAHTAPLSAEEFEISMKLAARQQEEYLKKAANLIDENSVKLLTMDIDVAAGKNMFANNCVACHGKLGEGGVGPNLTDAYWLHGGSLSEIFKSIKYGWQEKGMKSWKEDFTPSQMAQLSSYIYKMKGSTPPNPKAPQGDLYTEATTASGDSSTVKPN